MELRTIIARMGKRSLRLTFGSREEAAMFRKAHPDHFRGYLLREKSNLAPLTQNEARCLLFRWLSWTSGVAE